MQTSRVAPTRSHAYPGAPSLAEPTLAECAARAATRYADANPSSRARFEEATRHMPGGDTRTINHFDPFPLTIVRGEGAKLYDVDGHEYLDFLNDYTAGLYGHSNPVIQAAIRQGAEHGLTFGGPSPNQHEFAELMCSRFPSVERIRFTCSGTESNLLAISLARAVTGRTGVMAFMGGYHGSVFNFSSPDQRLKAPFPWVVGTYNDVAGTRALIRENGSQLAAVIVEPMLAAGGCLPATAEFLSMLREETRNTGTVLIFDEVQTSRLGPGGRQGELGIHADLTTFGKYLGGGASFGAFGGRADLVDYFDPRRSDNLNHPGTHNNNSLTMAAGLAGLRDVFTPEAATRLTERGYALRDELNRVAQRRNAPAQVTGCGSIMTVHFQRKPLREPGDAATPPEARTLFHLEMLLAGVFLAPRGFVTVSLAHTDEHCQNLAERFDTFLDTYAAVIDGALGAVP